jgi:IS605 OrfB family transposase
MHDARPGRCHLGSAIVKMILAGCRFGVHSGLAGLGGFVGGSWWDDDMPRRRDPRSPAVVHRTARAGLRLARGQRRRLTGLLVSAGDVWACVLELNAWRRARQRAVARRAPKPGQRGSRRWRQYRRRQRIVEARHRRRVAQAQHEAARTLISWAAARRIGTLAVGDPRGVLSIDAGRRHNRRTRTWRVGHPINVLRDKAAHAGIALTLVDERGTSSTCPACRARVPKPRGRVFCCPRCGRSGHRDLIAAANIAARAGGGITPAIPAGVTHRRAGNHLPGVSPPRRDPRRRPHHGDPRGSPGRHLPAPPAQGDRGVARPTARTW